MNQIKGPLLFRLFCRAVWLFSPKYHIEGRENLPNEPCVIVGNHSQMYGPIAAELWVPGEPYTWCTAEMMDRKQVPDYAYQDFWSGKPRSVRWFFRLLSYAIAPLAQYIFTHARTIAVHRDAHVIGTFRDSVARLQEGRNLVIFPEHYTPYNNVVHEFQDRFIDVARMYRRSAGRDLVFVPLYVAPRLKTLFFGAPVVFQPDAPLADERQRICRELMNEITRMAAAQPEHTVVPYPNVPRRQYPKNIPVEDLTHEA